MAAGLIIPVGSKYGFSSRMIEFDGGATFAAGDLVNLESGELDVVAAGEQILGQVVEAGTSSSTKVAVVFTPGAIFVMDNDNDGTTFAATHVGAKFKTTGGTGVQIIDTSTVQTSTVIATIGADYQFDCMAYNPQGVRPDLDSDVSVGKFVVRPLAEQLL